MRTIPPIPKSPSATPVPESPNPTITHSPNPPSTGELGDGVVLVDWGIGGIVRVPSSNPPIPQYYPVVPQHPNPPIHIELGDWGTGGTDGLGIGVLDEEHPQSPNTSVLPRPPIPQSPNNPTPSNTCKKFGSIRNHLKGLIFSVILLGNRVISGEYAANINVLHSQDIRHSVREA